MVYRALATHTRSPGFDPQQLPCTLSSSISPHNIKHVELECDLEQSELNRNELKLQLNECELNDSA